MGETRFRVLAAVDPKASVPVWGKRGKKVSVQGFKYHRVIVALLLGSAEPMAGIRSREIC